MSTDNGVYILSTMKDHQYRVLHTSAIGNIYYDELHSTFDSKQMSPLSLLEYFGDCKCTHSETMALRGARSILYDPPVCEYGIQFLYPGMSWEDIIEEGTEMARKYLKRHGNANEQINRIASGIYLKKS